MVENLDKSVLNFIVLKADKHMTIRLEPLYAEIKPPKP